MLQPIYTDYMGLGSFFLARRHGQGSADDTRANGNQRPLHALADRDVGGHQLLAKREQGVEGPIERLEQGECGPDRNTGTVAPGSRDCSPGGTEGRVTLGSRLLSWLTSHRRDVNEVVAEARSLTEQKELLTAATGNWLAQRYTGQWEGNRNDSRTSSDRS